MPALRIRRQGARLWVGLDTPASAVNVFGHRPAAELRELLETLPDDVEQLVLHSVKPGSFVNGAGLLYANSMKSPAAAIRTSADVRETYRLLADCRAQTVAVVEGNCYGCGLELALCCDLLLARDCFEAHFKMTELVDYRFVPLFGGTWRLPRRVGAEGAKRLLLDGETWSAKEARRRGLVDRLLPSVGFDRALERALERAAPRRRLAKVTPKRREVAPPRRAIWERTEALIDAAPRVSDAVAAATELDAFAETVTSPDAKAAMRFFFVRHMARAASWHRTARTPPPVRLVPRSADSSAIARELRRRTPLHAGPAVARVTGLSPKRARVGGVELLFPLGAKGRLCEVRAGADSLVSAREIARALDWIGYEPVLTLGSGFVSEQLLAATRRTIRALMRQGHPRPAIAAALWRFGFSAPLAGPPRGRTEAPPRVVETLVNAWREILQQALDDGALLHPAQGEVLVHELLGYPLERGTVLRSAAGIEEARR